MKKFLILTCFGFFVVFTVLLLEESQCAVYAASILTLGVPRLFHTC